jgi:hypothetical protein
MQRLIEVSKFTVPCLCLVCKTAQLVKYVDLYFFSHLRVIHDLSKKFMLRNPEQFSLERRTLKMDWSCLNLAKVQS